VSSTTQRHHQQGREAECRAGGALRWTREPSNPFQLLSATTLTKHGLCTAGKAGRLHKDTTPPTDARGKQGSRHRGGGRRPNNIQDAWHGRRAKYTSWARGIGQGRGDAPVLVWRVALCPSIKIVTANVMVLWVFFRGSGLDSKRSSCCWGKPPPPRSVCPGFLAQSAQSDRA
jgi:hypothetical protein